MSAYFIEMKYQQSLAQAAELDSIANRLSKIGTDDVENLQRKISANWQGENSRQYLLKLGQMTGKIENTVSDIRNTANTIRTIAENVRQAELAALARIQQAANHMANNPTTYN